MQKLHNKSDNPAVEKRLDDILEELYSFYSQKIDMSLERVERFLRKLGDPHLNLPPVVHIAGTNGKGSTIAMLRSLLEADGKRAHIMTSPHLVHPTERIRLAGELITSEYLIELLQECLAVNRSEPITFFEMFTAATYLAFSRADADICLLETGMGGRLDATNVVPHPICTIITTISKDHEKFLGDTLEKIAFEKGGIMKSGVPCVIGYQTDAAIAANINKVFQNISNDLPTKAPLVRYGHEWNIAPQKNRMHYTFADHDLILERPNLLGLHQIYNAGAAISAYDIIISHLDGSKELSTDQINKALGIVHWPGRLQCVTNGSLCDSIPQHWELYLDGGHNDSAGAFLAAQAREWKEQDNKPLHLIVAMVDRKNPTAFLAPLLPYTTSITLMEIKGEETSFNPLDLKIIAENMGFQNVSISRNFKDSIQNITETGNQGRVLTTGSLYFLGNILAKTTA